MLSSLDLQVFLRWRKLREVIPEVLADDCIQVVQVNSRTMMSVDVMMALVLGQGQALVKKRLVHHLVPALVPLANRAQSYLLALFEYLEHFPLLGVCTRCPRIFVSGSSGIGAWIHWPGIFECNGRPSRIALEAARFLHPSHGKWDVGLVLEAPVVSSMSAGYLHLPISLVCPGPFALTLFNQASQVMGKNIVG